MSTEAIDNCDRNKTDLTRKVTAAAHTFLSERGFKPAETEVPVSDGWCADVAGVLSPTRSEATTLKLIPAKSKRIDYAQREEAYRLLPRILTGLVEVKTSRGDFTRDKKWLLPSPVSLKWLAVPGGMIREEEWPTGWGIIECSPENGTVRRCVRPAPLVCVPTEDVLHVMYNVAVRCDHRVRYARHRELHRQARAQRNESVSRSRFSDLLRALLRVVHGEGENVEDALGWSGIRNLSTFEISDLQTLWAVKPPRDRKWSA